MFSDIDSFRLLLSVEWSFRSNDGLEAVEVGVTEREQSF